MALVLRCSAKPRYTVILNWPQLVSPVLFILEMEDRFFLLNSTEAPLELEGRINTKQTLTKAKVPKESLHCSSNIWINMFWAKWMNKYTYSIRWFYSYLLSECRISKHWCFTRLFICKFLKCDKCIFEELHSWQLKYLISDI